MNKGLTKKYLGRFRINDYMRIVKVFVKFFL